jgi:hypothetical protein
LTGPEEASTGPAGNASAFSGNNSSSDGAFGALSMALVASGSGLLLLLLLCLVVRRIVVKNNSKEQIRDCCRVWSSNKSNKPVPDEPIVLDNTGKSAPNDFGV